MIIAVDTGGTKTLVAVFADDGTLLEKQKFLTPTDTEVYAQQVAAAITELSSGYEDARGIMIAVPGVVEQQQAVFCKNLGWHNVDVVSLLQPHFPHIPIWLENDANLGGLGAARLLEPQPRRCLYITISTGIGGGFTVNGAICQDIATSEMGDILLEHDGQFVTWEQLVSGSTIFEEQGVHASELTDTSVIRTVAQRMSRGFLVLIPVLRPDVVAVGGGVGAHFHLFADDVAAELEALPERYRCPIVIAPHPEEIVTYGCYFYAKDQLGL